MILLLSPSKTLDYETPYKAPKPTQPMFLDHSQVLIKELRKLSEAQLGKLMDISPKLSALNVERYKQFSLPFTEKNARPALLAFKGDVYDGIEAYDYTTADFTFAQKHLRILSGLYGLLRPLDLIRPYRLEMGTKLKNSKGKDLYAFWGDSITQAINEAAKGPSNKAVINLASEEYFGAVRPKLLDKPLIQCVFKEKKGREFKVVALFAKKARGMMANFVVRNRIIDPKGLKDFTEGSYRFHAPLSDDNRFVFVR